MKDASAILGIVTDWLYKITSLSLLLLLAATAVKATGLVNVPFLRGIGHVEIAYLCGAFWLLRK